MLERIITEWTKIRCITDLICLAETVTGLIALVIGCIWVIIIHKKGK